MTNNELRNIYTKYLRYEKSLSENTALGYQQDLDKLFNFLDTIQRSPLEVTFSDLQEFVYQYFKHNSNTRTQSRIICGIRSFYRFLLYHDYIETDPSELLQVPKLDVHLPEVLAVEEIDAMIEQIDMSDPLGHRNRAIIEMLYGSGLRVSELVNLKLSKIFWEDDYLLVTGKGDKERFVPLSPIAKKQCLLWLESRNHFPAKKGASDFVFLNRRGAPLTRAMIFTIIKRLAAAAGVQKTISPHTFRHSFATHMLQNGADLRVIQELLGHESITTTEIYTHLDMHDLRKAIIQFHPANRK